MFIYPLLKIRRYPHIYCPVFLTGKYINKRLLFHSIYPVSGFFTMFRMTYNIFYPTLPSKLMLINFAASMANSIGRFCITSLQKPFTINPIASSSPMPRCWQ